MLVEQQVQQANLLASKGQWDQAVAIYQELLRQYPYSLELREQFIIVSFRNGDYHSVIQQYLDCAEIYYTEGDWESAIRRYEETLRLPEIVDGQHGPGAGDPVRELVDQVRPDIYYQFGDFHLDRGYADLALQYLQKSDQLSPGRWETHMAMGQAHLLKGQDKEAIQAFHQVLQLAPEEAAVALELLGEVFLRQRRPIDNLREWFYRSADAYYKKGAVRDAIRICNRILDFDPDNNTVKQKLQHLIALERPTRS
ncbi:MAG: tetratricopeptide repeat protein [Vulcanimicrobiota bacterium]